MFKKKFIYDSFLNIIASALPLIALQIIILPLIGMRLNEIDYGLVITLISLSTLLSHPLGNVLNNVRLLQNNTYKEKNFSGDYNLLLVYSLAVNIIIISIGTYYYIGSFSLIDTILLSLLSCLSLLREYLIVAFRLVLNYKAILINNLILGIGYLVGLIFFYIFGYWQLIYIIGSLISLIYIICRSDLLKEGTQKTPLFKETSYKSIVLFISVFLKTALGYADKLILFPLMGPSSVAIYYTATVLGKLITRVMTPISGVMLSHLANMKRMEMKNFLRLLFFTSVIGIIGYVFTVGISKPLLNILYPKWADETMELIYITTATAMMGVISSVIHPIILRFNNMNWQIVISSLNLLVAIISVYVFYNLYGLIGFCIGMFITSIVKLFIMTSIFIFSYKKEDHKVLTENSFL